MFFSHDYRENEDRLAKINSVFRTIDLATLSLAPLSAGLVFDFISNSAAAYFIAGWNIISVIFEYCLLKSIYKEFPMLAHKSIFENNSSNEETGRTSNFFSKIKDGGRAWILYMKYPVRNAGFGLACLYMTVLGFDNITYGFCLQQCVTESVLGALVGVSAIFGVSGSISFPFLRKRFGLTKTGLVGMFLLVATLTLCLISIWLDGSPFQADYFFAINSTNSSDSILSSSCLSTNSTGEFSNEESSYSFVSVAVLMTGLITARFGLWIFDLTITQLIQENVQEEHRGVIGGVQNALNSAMDTIKFILVIVLPQAETFGWLIIASYGFICMGAIFYISYVVCYNPKTSETTTTASKNITSTTYQATDQGSPNVAV